MNLKIRKTCFATAAIILGLSAVLTARAQTAPTLLPVDGTEYLASFQKGVAAADAQQKVLQIVCIGDSNTEGPAYVSELRRILQGCYGERGIGYHSLGSRSMPESPKIEKTGKWTDLRDAPQNAAPPGPYFALDGIWTQTEDPQAAISVEFNLGEWGKVPDRVARLYNGGQRVRIHYQTGPGLGNFSLFKGASEFVRINCVSEKPGYAISEPFMADSFRIAGIKGKVVIFGFDAERVSYLHGQPVLKGGAIVHALGKSWGMTREPAAVEDDAYQKFFTAIKPDLVTILLGTNDMHNLGQPNAYRSCLTTIIQKIRKAVPDTSILVIACPEAGQTKEGMSAQYRDIAKEVAAANKCAFWSLQDLVGARSRVWTQQGFFNDGLHYNSIGGNVLARMLLRQIAFDINDLKHYPVLQQPPAQKEERATFSIPRIKTVELSAIPEALKGVAPQFIFNDMDKASETRIAIAGENLAVHVIAYDKQCVGPQDKWPGGGTDLYVAGIDNMVDLGKEDHGNGTGMVQLVKQVAFSAKKTESGRQIKISQGLPKYEEQAADFPFEITPLQPAGYEVKALIPLKLVGVKPDAKEFFFEQSVMYSDAPGAAANFLRMFAVRGDRGAFRDSSQSAQVKINP